MHASSPLTRPSLLLSLRDVGNQHAWEVFVEVYTPLVFGHCVRRGLQAADAADVTQDVMRAVAKGIQKLEYDRSRGTFRAWLLTVTRNKLSTFFTAQARRPRGTGDTAVVEFLDALPSPETESEWEAEYRARLFAVAADRVKGEFQEKTWTAFWRTACENHPVTRVAAELGLSPGAVYIARSRVLARLRGEVAALSEEEDLLRDLA